MNQQAKITDQGDLPVLKERENRYVPTKCSDRLPPVDGDGLWSGMLFIGGDLRVVAFYDEAEGLGYWDGLYSGVVVIIDPTEYDRVYWCDYPKLQ